MHDMQSIYTQTYTRWNPRSKTDGRKMYVIHTLQHKIKIEIYGIENITKEKSV